MSPASPTCPCPAVAALLNSAGTYVQVLGSPSPEPSWFGEAHAGPHSGASERWYLEAGLRIRRSYILLFAIATIPP